MLLVQYRAKTAEVIRVTGPQKALDRLRAEKWEETGAYDEALRMVDQAVRGHCSPKAAMAAFTTLLKEQRRVIADSAGTSAAR